MRNCGNMKPVMGKRAMYAILPCNEYAAMGGGGAWQLRGLALPHSSLYQSSESSRPIDFRVRTGSAFRFSFREFGALC